MFRLALILADLFDPAGIAALCFPLYALVDLSRLCFLLLEILLDILSDIGVVRLYPLAVALISVEFFRKCFRHTE